MSLSNYAENNLLNFLFTNTALTGSNARPTAWYVSLHTADPGETGTNAEVTGGSYARAAATFGTTSTGAVSNSGTVTFPTSTAAWGTITHVSVWDAASGGDHLGNGPHNPATQVIPSGSAYTIAPGALTVSMD